MFTLAPRRLIRSLIVSFFISLLMLAGLTFLLYRFRLGETQITVGIYAIYMLSCLIGGFLAGRSMKNRRFLWGLLSGILYFLFLFLLSSLQETGITAEPSRILMSLGLCGLSGMIGGMIS